MMRTTRSTLLLVLLLFLSGFSVVDEIHLANGKVYVVKSWKFEGEYIVLRLHSGTILKYRREQVAKIQIAGTKETKEISSPVAPDQQSKINGQPERLMAIPDGVMDHFKNGNTAAALNTLETSDREYKKSIDYKMVRGTLMMRGGLFAEAEGILKDALLEDPEYPGGHFALAQSLYYQGKWQEAVAAYNTALTFVIPESARVNIQNRLDEISALRGNTILENGLLLATFENRVTAQSQLKAITDNLEDGLKTAMDAVQHQPNGRILVVISSRPSYNFIESDKSLGTFDGKVTIPLSIAATPAGRSMMVHEFVHALLHSKTLGNCPRWLHEGLAQYWSGTSLDTFKFDIRDYLNRRKSLDDYSDGLSLVTFMFSENRNRLLVDILLTSLARGRYIEKAFMDTYGFSLNEFRRQRDNWLRKYFNNRN